MRSLSYQESENHFQWYWLCWLFKQPLEKLRWLQILPFLEESSAPYTPHGFPLLILATHSWAHPKHIFQMFDVNLQVKLSLQVPVSFSRYFWELWTSYFNLQGRICPKSLHACLHFTLQFSAQISSSRWDLIRQIRLKSLILNASLCLPPCILFTAIWNYFFEVYFLSIFPMKLTFKFHENRDLLVFVLLYILIA